jgi:hypothetical protein
MPKGAVYVGRPTKWGNPYRWQEYPTVGHVDGEPVGISDADRRRHAVADFRYLLLCGGSYGYPTINVIRRELVGKDLLCWCPEGQPCHADLLLQVANEVTVPVVGAS